MLRQAVDEAGGQRRGHLQKLMGVEERRHGGVQPANAKHRGGNKTSNSERNISQQRLGDLSGARSQMEKRTEIIKRSSLLSSNSYLSPTFNVLIFFF